MSRPIIQSLPDPGTARLNAALAKLGRDPRDIAALIEAGDAARGAGDFDAAIGFYRRADEVAPNQPAVKAGLARAYVMNGDPVSAIPLFDAAERAGAVPIQLAADRGLAYDLVGDNAAAQRYYAMAMATQGSDEVRMRLALSLAIAGDAKAADATLLPLLRKQDKPGWRTRAFALAIAGDTKQAVDLAGTILPPQLAENIAPYLRYMPRLTRAQQAAAANLGRFPRASEVGRDDPRIAAYAPLRTAAADSGLVPKGEPLGGDRSAKAARARAKAAHLTRLPNAEPRPTGRTEAARQATLASADPDRVAPPEPKPAIESGGELPPLAGSAAAKAPPPPARSIPTPAPPTPAPTSASHNAPSPVGVTGHVATPGFDLGNLQAAHPPSLAASPPPAPAPASSPPPRRPTSPPAEASPPPSSPLPGRPSLAAIFADFGKPTMRAEPTAGAVDIRKIGRAEVKPDPKAAAKPADKPKPKKPEKPAPPAHPSRIWVQMGVGRDKDAIAFDWRRYAKQAPALFKGRQAYVSEMGRTNRILAGPFGTQKSADQFVAELKKAGFDGAMPWTSPAGQVVDPLSDK